MIERSLANNISPFCHSLSLQSNSEQSRDKSALPKKY